MEHTKYHCSGHHAMSPAWTLHDACYLCVLHRVFSHVKCNSKLKGAKMFSSMGTTNSVGNNFTFLENGEVKPRRMELEKVFLYLSSLLLRT